LAKYCSVTILIPSLDQELSPDGEVLSFAGPKESTQRKRPTRDVKTAQAICGAEEIFGLAIHGSVRKRRPSMAGALRVCGYNCTWKRAKVKNKRPLDM
jgi:hypothetical protein